MAITSKFLRDIEAEARPIIERQMNDAKIIAGLRDVVAAAGGDWGALKALIKARVEDDNDETGEGKRVRKICEKADCIVAYDDMLGSNMNEKNFSASQSYAEAKGREKVTVAHLLSATPSELTDTQEQPEAEPCDYCADHAPSDVYWVCPKCDAEWFPAEDENSPSPANTPRLAADDEAAQANPTSSAPNPNPQPNLLPGAVKAPEAESSPASGATLSEKKDCLKLKDGHCKISFDTPALCSVCNAERMKARAA